MSIHSDWFETFFEGLALDLWRGAVTQELTAREAAFLATHLALQPGMSALDVPCGNGRHAIEIAKRGIAMTGFDISTGFLKEARANAPAMEWVKGDMRSLPWTGRFDAADCWGNSFGYFDHDQCQRFLAAIASGLKPGGRFILESGAVSESILPVLQPERTMRIGDIDFASRNVYNAEEGRMDITYIFSRGARQEVKPIHQWVHSAAEIRRMLRRASLETSRHLWRSGRHPLCFALPALYRRQPAILTTHNQTPQVQTTQ
jgi:cyclopropane fatty-acyl-phospholipid synthase-like methyltransferase